LSFTAGIDEFSQPITKTFVVGDYTYTNRCGFGTTTGGVGPTDSVTVTGPSFDLRWVSETSNNGGATTLGSPSYSDQSGTNVQLANAASVDANNVVVVSPAELTNLATGATQTISLIAQSNKNTSVISCFLSGTVTLGG
jgi:hypothetical protein